MPSPAPRTVQHGDHSLDGLLAAKGATTVTFCLPARDEASTIGAIVEEVHRRFVVEAPLVDDLLVIDDGSSDDTASVAAAAGARVVAAADVLPDERSEPGKGQALWRSLHASTGDIVAWCDADITDFGPRFVLGLVGPLLTDPELVFVKGSYDRPDDGGRVTELTARPAIALLLPEVAGFDQPLAGEFAGRRAALEEVGFVDGYGVDLGLLVDLVRRHGIDRVAQVDLGTRRHRNRSLAELGPQAVAVLRVALARAGVDDLPLVADLTAVDGSQVRVACTERPPLAELLAARRATA